MWLLRRDVNPSAHTGQAVNEQPNTRLLTDHETNIQPPWAPASRYLGPTSDRFQHPTAQAQNHISIPS